MVITIAPAERRLGPVGGGREWSRVSTISSANQRDLVKKKNNNYKKINYNNQNNRNLDIPVA